MFIRRSIRCRWAGKKHGESGIEITDWWPHLARQVDELCFVRNLWTTDNDHAAENQIHTGRHRLDEPQPSIALGALWSGNGQRKPPVRRAGAATVDHLDEPVGVGHFVFDQVLATLDVQLGVAHVVHVAIGRLQSVNEGLARRLVAMPGVVRPQPPADASFGSTLRVI